MGDCVSRENQSVTTSKSFTASNSINSDWLWRTIQLFWRENDENDENAETDALFHKQNQMQAINNSNPLVYRRNQARVGDIRAKFVENEIDKS